MQYFTHHNKKINAIGTCLQGEVTASYNLLCSLFLSSLGGDGYKVDAEWRIQFEDGLVATIYNYKDGINYCGSDGTPKEDITEWHVGGKTKEVVRRINDILNNEDIVFMTDLYDDCTIDSDKLIRDAQEYIEHNFAAELAHNETDTYKYDYIVYDVERDIELNRTELEHEVTGYHGDLKEHGIY